MSKKILIGAIVLVMALGCLFAGCAAQPAEEPAVAATTEPTEEPAAEPTEEPTEEPTVEPIEEAEPTEEPAPEYRKLGTEGAQAFVVLLTNNMGQDITSMEIKPSVEGESAYSENIVNDGLPFAQNEVVDWYYTPEDGDGADEATDSIDPEDEDTAVRFSTVYDIRVTLGDESRVYLYDFGFEDMAEAELCLEDGVAYVNYVSVATGDTVSTKDAQQARMDKIEEAQAAQKSAQKSSSGSSGSSGGGSNSGGGDSAPEQTVDECLEDNVAWND